MAIFPPREENISENRGNTEKYKVRGEEREREEFLKENSHLDPAMPEVSHYWTFLLHQHKSLSA